MAEVKTQGRVVGPTCLLLLIKFGEESHHCHFPMDLCWFDNGKVSLGFNQGTDDFILNSGRFFLAKPMHLSFQKCLEILSFFSYSGLCNGNMTISCKTHTWSALLHHCFSETESHLHWFSIHVLGATKHFTLRKQATHLPLPASLFFSYKPESNFTRVQVNRNQRGSQPPI